MVEYAERLRTRLAERTGAAPKFGWYFRTDPQIAEIHGRADHGLVAFPDRTARLQAAGDYLGVHAHSIRWAADRGLWVHEFEDWDWQGYATRFALEAYAQWAGGPARLFRSGAGFLTNQIVAAAEGAGVEVDLTWSRSRAGACTPRRCRPGWTRRPSWDRTPTARAPRGCQHRRCATTSGSTGAAGAGGS